MIEYEAGAVADIDIEFEWEFRPETFLNSNEPSSLNLQSKSTAEAPGINAMSYILRGHSQNRIL